MSNDKMISSALNALEIVLDLNESDKILIVTDTPKQNLADVFRKACEIKGCITESFVIDESSRPLKTIPAGLEKMLDGKTIVLNILHAMPEEVPFRVEWILKVEKLKTIRTAHMPGINEEMMTDGPVDVDYTEMKQRCDALLGMLQNVVSLHIRTQAGTNLRLGVKNRKFIHDLHINPGEIQNIPCGEVYCAPEETKANGRLVIDASGGDLGLLETPLVIYIVNGRIQRFESADQNLVNRIEELTGSDIESRTIGELGIGINPGARIKGNMLEDEKAIGTAHIAFGNNEDMPGGRNHAGIHRDLLFNSPTIKAYYSDGTEKIIIEKGVVQTA